MAKQTSGLIEQFDNRGNDPLAWYTAALPLLTAAETLKRAADDSEPLSAETIEKNNRPDAGLVHPSEMMLRGFAVECLLKGLWVQKGGILAEKGQLLRVPNAGDHELLQLADAVGLTLSAKQRSVLDRLTVYIKVVGRYPVPRRAEDLRLVGWRAPTDTETLGAIVEGLLSTLRKSLFRVNPSSRMQGIPIVGLRFEEKGMKTMKLSRTERLILVNQYRILALLRAQDPDEQFYARAIDALEHGYELEYERIAAAIAEDEISPQTCDEVISILQMHRVLRYAYDALEHKMGIDERDIRFLGFDGNNEGRELAYCRFYCSDPQQPMFAELPRHDDFNSHLPMLPRYRAMLEEWRASNKPYELTKDDIIRIAAAARVHRTEAER